MSNAHPKSRTGWQPRRGSFRLRELCVVVVLIVLVLVFTLPAVQSAREATRRGQCNNNLKQIGLGLQTYADINKHFPYEALWGQYPASNTKQGAYHYPWSVNILSQIEAHPPDFHPIDERLPIWNQSQQYGTGGAAKVTPPAYFGYIQSQQIPPYRCPSETTFNGPNDLPSLCMWMNYAGSVGVGFYSAVLKDDSNCEGETTAPLSTRGMFAFNEPAPLKFEDGSSNTIAVAEVSACGVAAPKIAGGNQYNSNPADDLVFAADADQPLPMMWKLRASTADAAWPPPLAAGGRGTRRAKLRTTPAGTVPVPMIFRTSLVALTESVTGTGPCSLPNTYAAAQGGPCGQAGGAGAVAGFELSGNFAGAPVVGIAPLYNAIYSPNSNWPGPDSNHPGVVLVVYADGHSGTISDHIDFSIWASLNTRAGGEPINGEY